jgi:hypothetical protein
VSGGMVSLSAVLGRGSWTPAMVVNFLGEPDGRTESSSPLYQLDRVIAAEERPEFCAARAMAKVRAGAMRGG